MSPQSTWEPRVGDAYGLALLDYLEHGSTFDAASRIGEEQMLEPPGSPEAEYGAAHPSEAVHIPSHLTR
ncbi:MAG TPA: hypothetical protein VEB69_15410 [Acidimicrobiia bacterium]|nr:hypothetical protein [Acidimicrobiia bacterium]